METEYRLLVQSHKAEILGLYEGEELRGKLLDEEIGRVREKDRKVRAGIGRLLGRKGDLEGRVGWLKGRVEVLERLVAE